MEDRNDSTSAERQEVAVPEQACRGFNFICGHSLTVACRQLQYCSFTDAELAAVRHWRAGDRSDRWDSSNSWGKWEAAHFLSECFAHGCQHVLDNIPVDRTRIGRSQSQNSMRSKRRGLVWVKQWTSLSRGWGKVMEGKHICGSHLPVRRSGWLDRPRGQTVWHDETSSLRSLLMEKQRAWEKTRSILAHATQHSTR